MPDDLHEPLVRSKAIDDFLKAVYFLQKQVDPVPTTLLAHTLHISAPSVTDMIKRLAGIDDDKEKRHKRDDDESGVPLLDYEPYRGVRLSQAGEKIALEVIRHHRLIELYLVQALGYSWDEVHEEAERLEHHISEKLEARIAAALGNPIIDPHGDPIPALDGTITTRKQTNLGDLSVNRPGTVSQILDQSVDVLRYLSELGLTPGAEIKVRTRAPLNDTITIDVGDTSHIISTQVARKVLVTSDED
jgi:DtxR family transcriptional regulator, Mn-dependent transcriptional regulator